MPPSEGEVVMRQFQFVLPVIVLAVSLMSAPIALADVVVTSTGDLLSQDIWLAALPAPAGAMP